MPHARIDTAGRRRRRFLHFSLAGVAGFAVDAGVLAAGLALGLPAWLARVPSFVAAVVTTWSINRRLTFTVTAPPSLAEFGAYLAAMSLGMAANLSIFAAGLAWGLPPLVALLLASTGNMAANYLGARRVLGRSGS